MVRGGVFSIKRFVFFEKVFCFCNGLCHVFPIFFLGFRFFFANGSVCFLQRFFLRCFFFFCNFFCKGFFFFARVFFFARLFIARFFPATLCFLDRVPIWLRKVSVRV